MTARTIPIMPNFFAGQKLTGTLMNLLGAYPVFWANRPMFRMYQAVAQSIPNNAYTQVICDTLDYDTDSGRSNVSPNSYTIPVGMTGRWQFGGVVGFVSNVTGSRFGVLYRNGVQVMQTQIPLPGSAASTEITFGDPILVNAGDVMALYCFQSSGGALNTDAGHSTFWGRLESLANP